MRRLLALALAGVLITSVASADHRSDHVNQRGDGWPAITGMILLNADHSSRPLDARPGRDPFMRTDRRYRCFGKEPGGPCLRFLERCGKRRRCVKDLRVHNELAGGHGNDTIFAGPHGDVLWGDFVPNGPRRQRDRLTGGAGRDFIYGSKGRNVIRAGPGDDFVKARYGRGRIDCGKGNDILYTSRRYRKRYRIRNCERRTTKASPGQGGTPVT